MNTVDEGRFGNVTEERLVHLSTTFKSGERRKGRQQPPLKNDLL